MSQNKIHFDYFQKSNLEKIEYNSLNKQNINLCLSKDCIEKNKKYVDEILDNHKLIQIKRHIFGILKNEEYIKNSGISLEYFLIDYLKLDLLNKINEDQWEENGVDMFYGNKIGIDMTVQERTVQKENKLNSGRKKINNGETFYYTVEEENGDKYDYPINNKEVPNSLALFNIASKLINKVVTSGKQNFSNNFEQLNDNDFIKLFEDFEIIKESFPKILNKIDFLNDINMSGIENATRYILDHELLAKLDKEEKEWLDSGYTTKKPDPSARNSNIIFKYNKKEKIVTFEVYSEDMESQQNISTLIYEFKYYICDRKYINNSKEEKKLKYKAVAETEKCKHSENQYQNKVIKLKKIAEEFNVILKQSKNYIQKTEIDENRVIKNYLFKFINELRFLNDNYISIHDMLSSFDKDKKDIFLKNISLLTSSNEELIEMKKGIYWLESFIDNVELLVKGKDISFDELGNGILQKEDILLKDPILLKFNFLEKSKDLRKRYKNILNLFKKIDHNGLNSINEKYEKKLSLNLQKLLFVSSPKFKSGKTTIDNILSELKNNLETSNLPKKNRILLKNKKNILLLIKELEFFIESILKIRNDVKNIDFKELLLSKLGRNNYVYSKKFLYNIIISIIFNGDTLNIKNVQKDKLIQKIEEQVPENNNIKTFITLLELYLSSKNIDDKYISKNVIKDDLLFYLKNIHNELDSEKESIHLIQEKTYNEEHREYFLLIDKIKDILGELFNKRVIRSNDSLIHKFIKNFSKYNVGNFDNNFTKLIKSIGLENDLNFSDNIRKMAEYREVFDEIMGMKYIKIDETLFNRNTNFDIEEKDISTNIDILKDKTIKINNLLKNIEK